MVAVAYKPHLGHCNKPFVFEAKDKKEAISFALCLNFYQVFLSENNHSQSPKPRLEFRKSINDTELRIDHQDMVNEFNKSPYFEMESVDELADGFAANKYGLRVMWLPQVPCKPFYFPVKDVDTAERCYKLLAEYDLYLLEDCESMRVDYSNMGTLEMINPLKDSEGEKWTSWYFEDGDTYYEDFDEYLRREESVEA